MTLEDKVDGLIISVTKLEEQSKSATTRIEETEEKLKENTALIGAIKELAIETKYMREDINKTTQRMDKFEEAQAAAQAAQKNEPDNWYKFKWLVLAAVITIIVAFIAKGVGLS